MTIDAHQHFWRLARGDYGWLTPDQGALWRDFGPDDLAPLLAATGVQKTILVQAAPTTAETRFLLEIAEKTAWVAGVVGWIDFEAEGAADHVARLASDPGLVGLRPMIQDLPDPEWMLRSDLASPLNAMARAHLAFDALVTPQHLPSLLRFLGAYPELRVVIDHGAKPRIARGELPDWSRAMRELAAGSDAVCKLSGLVTEAGPSWTIGNLKPYVDVLLETFGPARLMWGSDWPVLNLTSSYAAWREASIDLLSDLSPEDKAMVFGGVAARTYGIAS